ncbi:MAG: radical SAM family heme chaperone HemW [Myxococcota bacterium]|nr:radical SAM family heme chaperone HemW [Myxococcota bacterium]
MQWGIYVHIPWCRSRCPYCAFNVEVRENPPTKAYTDALTKHWRALSSHFEGQADSVFFGGGTPSLHPPELLKELVEVLSPAPQAEITLEANPGTVGPELLNDFLEAGINRLSLGIQTFDPKHARFLNRAHSVADARDLLKMVRMAGFESWSADLIFALPNQNLTQFERDLDTLVSLDPPHVSLYGLTAEPGTPYTQALQAGAFPEQDEDTWADMYELAVSRLSQAGLERYEVSNFARKGHRSRHNEHYWRARPYAGIGAGAHGWLPNGQRTVTRSRPDEYIENPCDWAHIETPTARNAAKERVLSTLRHVDGIDLRKLSSLGFSLDEHKLASLLEHNLVELRENHLVLGTNGWNIADGLVRRISDALCQLT